MNTFEKRIQEPEEITHIVEETHIRAGEKAIRLLLNHEEEKNVVRGRGEPYRHTEDEEIIETRRRDGGLSWYHDNNSRCLMVAVPNDGTKSNQKYMKTWGSALSNYLEGIGYDVEMVGADLYDVDTGEQLVGLSASISDDSAVMRACWYEEEPEVDELLEADGIDPDRFYSAINTVEGFYDHLRDSFDSEDVEFISKEAVEATEDYVEREEGLIKGSCVLGAQDRYIY